MSILDKIEAVIHHKHNVQQLTALLAPKEEGPTVATVSLAQLSLIPNTGTLLNDIATFTGLQAPITALESLKSLVQAGNFDPASVDAFLADVQTVLTSAGAFVQGGKFAALQAEVQKYKTLVDAVEAGQNPVVATIAYVTKAGVHREYDLSLSEKAQAAV